MVVAPRTRRRSPAAGPLLPLAGLAALVLTACGGDDGGSPPTEPPPEPEPTTGTVEVSASTTGDTLDRDGYTVTLDGGDAQSLDPDGTVTFGAVEEGDHEVELSGVQVNCGVDGDAAQTVSVTAEATATASFDVACEPALVDRIVFATNRDGDLEIYSVAEDGSGLTRLTANSDANDTPDVTSDGTRLTFRASFDVAVKDVGESGYATLEGLPGASFYPVWSPDGSRIAFTNTDDGDSEIHAMDADGTDVTRLTDNASVDQHPDWSPDGARIAFVSDRSGSSEIWVMDADGSDPEQLTGGTESGGLQPLSPAWSPDGSRIAFATNADDAIYTMAADGTDLQLVTDTGLNRHPHWSSDGSRIVFASTRDGDFEIYTIGADGTDVVRVTDDPGNDVDPMWSPGR
jgi:Tol biopolymer transport system component